MKAYQRSYIDIIGDVETRLLAMHKLCESIYRNKGCNNKTFSEKVSDLLAGLWELADFLEVDVGSMHDLSLDKLQKQWKANAKAQGVTLDEELPV